MPKPIITPALDHLERLLEAVEYLHPRAMRTISDKDKLDEIALAAFSAHGFLANQGRRQ